MRISNLFIIAALPALSLAETVDSLASDVPLCALGPLSIAAGENSCNMDAKCLCSDQTFITSLTAKVKAACSEDELNTVVQLATDACKTAGVTVDIPVDSASNSTGNSTDNSGWGERSSRANLAMVIGAVGLTAHAVL